MAPVEDPVEVFPVEALPIGGSLNEVGSLPPLTGRVGILPMPGTSASSSFPSSLGSLVLPLAVVGRA